MKTNAILGAVCSVLVLSFSSCSKNEGVNSMNLATDVTSKPASNIWTENGNPKLTSEPTFVQIPGTLTFQFTGEIKGLGNASSATLTIDAVVMVDPSCHNPGNGAVVKGVSKPVTKSVTKTYQLTNGKFNFSVNTDPITVADLGGSICPNDNWVTEIDAVSLKSYVIKINGIDFYSKTIF